MRSLYAKVLAVLLLLVITLVVQFLLSRNGLITLFNDEKAITQSYQNVSLVYELERDVIDLQRNLLIYKETASDTSSLRFYQLMDSVESKLNIFLKISKSGRHQLDEEIIHRMVEHLANYKENFDGVISGRKKHNKLLAKIEETAQKIQNINEKNLKHNEYIEVQYHVEKSENLIHQYLNAPDAEFITNFKENITHTIKLLSKDKNGNKESIKLLKKYKKSFIKLTHITRGYVFLVNVVMAGSANEFLYLSRKIRKSVTEQQLALIDEARLSGQNIQFNYNFSSFALFLLVMIFAWFLIKRILLPVKGITDVFRVLARGDEVNEIPGTQRGDEIGALAKAAEVFHNKNKQTHELLERSQDMIANQEVLNIQLEAEKDKAEQAAQSKSMFLANMSHEIRTPMNGIVGLVDLLLKTPINDKQKNYLNRVAYSGEIMMNVINDILDFSKIEAGKMEIETIEFDINSLIENLISSMAVKLSDKALDLRVVVDKTVPKTLMGDPLRISQILLNICNNAIKFTEHGFIEVNFSYPSPAQQQLCIEVVDTGIGMNDKQIKTIFDSFTQADGTTSRKYGGTGLGLAIVKQLVLLMGGNIKVDSQHGKGASIHVSIQAPSVGQEMALQPITSGYDKLLLVTDDHQQKMASTFLSHVSANIAAVTAQNFNQTKNKCDAVIFSSSFIHINANYQQVMADYQQQGIPVGLVLESSEKHLKKVILSEVQVSVLVHPFSPKRCNDYLIKLLTSQTLDTPEKQNDQQANNQFSGHVLLVEDNEINQLVAGDMLESMGVSIEVVSDGQQAVDKIMSGAQFDLIFMDVQMPVMDGYTATKAIRAAGFDQLNICGLSANALKEDYERASAAGMNDYLTKPLQLLDMQHTLKKYLKLAQ